MKTKFLSVILLIAILVTITASMVAATNFTAPTTVDLSKTVSSATFEVDNTLNSNDVIVPSSLSISDGFGKTIALTVSDATSTGKVEANTKEVITVSYTTLPTELALGTHSGKLTLKDAVITTDTLDVTVDFESSYCEFGCTEDPDLDLDVKIDNVEGFGEEDEEWYPLDQIEVEVTVDNKGDDTIDEIIVEWCLYSPADDECVMDDKESDFRLKEDKDKEILIEFQVDPNDIEDSDDYVLYVKVYSDDSDYGEDVLCTEFSENIDIMRDDDFVILDNIIIPETIFCGVDLEVTADVWNIGNDEQEDVYVVVYNEKLGINERIDVGDIDPMENDEVRFNLPIPKDAEEGTYFLELMVFDEYDDVFENDNDDEARFSRTFEVEGNCEVQEKEVSAIIAAELDSDAIAGEQLVIKGMIKNTGDEEATYTISVTGYSLWSDLDKIDPSKIALDADESEEFYVYLDVNEDAAGEQFFTIRASSDGGTVKQEISVLLEGEDTDVSLTGSAISDHLRDNWFIWVIVLINIILIIAIILVARRIVTAR